MAFKKSILFFLVVSLAVVFLLAPFSHAQEVEAEKPQEDRNDEEVAAGTPDAIAETDPEAAAAEEASDQGTEGDRFAAEDEQLYADQVDELNKLQSSYENKLAVRRVQLLQEAAVRRTQLAGEADQQKPTDNSAAPGGLRRVLNRRGGGGGCCGGYVPCVSCGGGCC